MQNTKTRIRDFVKSLKAVQGALLVGSLAYGTEKPSSDIDLIVVSRDMKETLTSPALINIDRTSGIRDLEARLKLSYQAHCFKGLVEGLLFSPSIYSFGSFKEIATIENGNINYMRNLCNEGIRLKLYDFSRHALTRKIANAKLYSGHFLAGEPISIKTTHGTTHFGPAPDSLLKSPEIILDTNNWMADQLQGFWGNVYYLMTKEIPNSEVLLQTGRLPVIRNQTLPGQVYIYIKKQLQGAKTRKYS